MNALFRIGASTFVVLLVWNVAVAQQPTVVKPLDSVNGIKSRISQNIQSSLQSTKSRISSVKPSFLKQPLSKSSIVSISGLSVGAGMQRIDNDYNAVYNFEGRLSLFKVPLELQLSHNQNRRVFDNPLQGNLFKMGFDRQSLLKSMVPELESYKMLSEKILGGRSVSGVLRERMAEELRKNGAENQQRFAGLTNYINQYGMMEELLKLDEAQLKEKLGTLVGKQKDSLTMLSAKGSR